MEKEEPRGRARLLERARELLREDNVSPDELPRHVDKRQVADFPHKLSLNAMAPEILRHIYSNLPDLRSVAHMAMSCKGMRNALREEESFIAKKLAARIIDDDDEHTVKLAFLAVKIHPRDKRSLEAVTRFCETYVRCYDKNEHEEPQKDLYSLRALPTIHQISNAARETAEWVWSAIEWPIVDTSAKQMSRTEERRLRRYIYIGEIGVSLLYHLPRGPPSRAIKKGTELYLHLPADSMPTTDLIIASALF